MNGEKLQNTVSQLPSYESWQSAQAAYWEARSAHPGKIDPQDRSQLIAQIDYLDSREASVAAGEQFKLEIASRGVDIPLHQKLGMLAVIDTPLNPNPSDIDRARRAVSIPMTNSDLPVKGMIIFPPDDPLERALEISKVISDVKKKFYGNRETPLAELSVGFGRSTNTRYYLSKENGFQVAEPVIEQATESEVSKVSYELPQIECTAAYFTRFHTMEKIDGMYSDERIDIPEIQQLTGNLHNTKLLFGNEVRLFKAAQTLISLRARTPRIDDILHRARTRLKS